MLGVLDKAILRLGDNSTVNFERTVIFLTSNLGALEMSRETQPEFGFRGMVPVDTAAVTRKLETIALNAAKRKFSPEFLNRIDVVSTYRMLDSRALAEILDLQIADLQRHIIQRLGPRGFRMDLSTGTREFLLRKGISRQYGARELKRTLHRNLTQPLAALLARGEIEPGGTVRVEVNKRGDALALRPDGRALKSA
jgi:ATP-dependent Clp protease ATP-binding subunit ClpA